MKKILLLFLINSIYFQFYGQEREWQYITTDSENREFYFKSNSYNTAWTKEVSSKITYFPDNKIQNKKIIDGYQITLYKFSCSEKKLGVGQITTYSKMGTALKTSRLDEYEIEMDYVIPDSIGEELLESFCNK